MYNSQRCNHLNDSEVAALIADNRLEELTRTVEEKGCVTKIIPTAREVNIWSLTGIGHNSINQYICIKAECKRLGVMLKCAVCNGDGEVWPSAEAKSLYDNWERIDPPSGDAYQVWETVSEGSPISPPFATPEELAKYMSNTCFGADEGTSYETWLKWINTSGWAPSVVVINNKFVFGVNIVNL
jgi:hypothetical protein